MAGDSHSTGISQSSVIHAEKGGQWDREMTHADQVRSDLGTGEVNLCGGGFSLHLFRQSSVKHAEIERTVGQRNDLRRAGQI